jgi:hypothetical protein
MATVIGLGVQFTANASGMTKGLSQVDRQLQQLGRQASGAASLFDSFASSSAAAASAQQQIATDLAFLNSAFKTGQVSAEQYVAELKGIVSSATAASQAFADGARITEQVATAEEKRSATLARLGQLLEQGAISQQTYDRAAAGASGANEAAAKAEQARAQALARAAQITQANLSPQQKYDQEVQELNQHLQAGRITQDTYNAALQRSAQQFAKATVAAARYDAAADGAGQGNTLAFNELSGILSSLPGSVGNVAGRLSGLSSAATGLGRVFAGGLSQGFGAVAASAAAMVNPLTLGIAGFAAFGAAATAIGSGLADLDSRVESLGFAAEQLGTDFQTIQTLEEAANRTGVSFEALTGGLQKFAVKLDESRDSSSGAAKALAELGISQEQLAGLSLPQQADLVATALAGVEDPARRAALQMELLGKSGENVRRGFTAIEESNSALDKFNARISDVDRERISSLGTAFDDVKTSILGLSQNLLTPFAGVAEGVANAIAESIGGITSIIAPLGDLVTPLLDGVGGAFTEFGKTVGLVADIIGKTLGVVLTPLTQLFSALGSPIDIVTLALQGVNAALELMTNAIDGAISSWNGFVSQIPLVGQYMTIATQEAQAGLGDVKAAAEAGLEVEPPESFASFEQAIGKARETLNGAIEEASQFGQAGFDAAFQFQEALAELQRQAEAGILNETAYEQEVQKATEAYRSQIGTIKEARAEEERKAEAARQAAEAAIQADQQRADAAIERLRVDQQFGGDSGRAEAAENVLAIEREQIRVEEELRAAREAGDQAAADAAAARLAQLDQVEARERDIASGAAKAREEADKKAKQAADERARAEEQKRKQIADLEERYQERFTEIQRERLDSLSRQSNQALAGNDIRTSAGAAQFLSLATGREDPAVDEYRKQLRELQDIKREIAKANAAPVEIAG